MYASVAGLGQFHWLVLVKRRVVGVCVAGLGQLLVPDLPSFIYLWLWPGLVGKVSHACPSGLSWCVAFLEPSRARGQQWRLEPPCTGQEKCPMPA